MKKRRTSRLTALLLVMLLIAMVGVLVAGCGGKSSTETTGTGSQPTGDPVVIGAIVSATGANSPLGAPERNVLEMMEGYINGAGGVLGRPLEIVIEDDKSDSAAAVTAANMLIDQKKVVALIAATGSASTMAVKEITAAKGLPQMAMVAGNEVTDEAPMEWIWRTPQKNTIVVARVLKYVTETLRVSKIAVLYDENAFGTSGYNEIAKTAGDHNLEIVASGSYKTDDTDLTAQLTRIKGESPEALIVWGTNPGPALAAKNMKQLGMDIPYIGSHGIANAKFIELAGDAAEGVVFPAGRLLVPSSITDAKQKAVTDLFVQRYSYAWGEAPNPFAGYAFEAIGLLVDAIERAGSTDPVAIQTALNATQGWVGPDGVYNYSATNHDGLTAGDMIMVKIQGGTWVEVK